ncbi:MAG: chlorophyll a/b-binding protein [Cyanobacteria bacterium P01_A01_bin.45]
MTDSTKTAPSNISTPVVEDRNAWRWGFTPQAEIWNGRLAMIGFSAAALIEILSGKGFLHFWGIL